MSFLQFTEFEWFSVESSQTPTEDSQLDIKSVALGKIINFSDEQEKGLIANRKLKKGSEFPARGYMDNHRPDGRMNRDCNPESFAQILAYTEQEDGSFLCIFILYSFSNPAQIWFWSSKTYQNTLYELKESYRLSIQPCWRMWGSQDVLQ